MKFLKLLIFLSARFVNSATTQRYRQVTKSYISIINCTEMHVSSLLHCTALSRESKDVTFFYNNQKKQCRRNCRFQYNMDAVIPGWQCYEMEWKTNAALNKRPLVSSVYSNNTSNWSPDYATDGVISIQAVQIFHSHWEPTPWIMVDLMNMLKISFVRVFLRIDDAGKRFHDVIYEISNNTSTYEQFGFFRGPAVSGQVVEICCGSPDVGQYVRLRVTQGSNNSLNIAELEIFSF